MLGALRSGARTRPGAPLPDLRATWRGCRPGAGAAADFARVCGLAAPDGRRLPPLFLHALAFRLQMAVLTHPALPVPIWRMLQVRDQLHDLLPASAGDELELDCRTRAQRLLPKGIEIDLHTTVRRDDVLIAESLNTFYARGSFAAGPDGYDDPPPAAPAPAVTQPIAAWQLPAGGGLRFGALTGDYNGVHLSDTYARVMGFRRAFFHPLRMVAQCLAHAGLQDAPLPCSLSVWLKGPVFHGSDLQLQRGVQDGATVLSLLVDEDPRPAVVVQLR